MIGKLKIGESMDSKEVPSKEKWNKVGERLKNTLQKSQWEIENLWQEARKEMLEDIWRNSKE